MTVPGRPLVSAIVAARNAAATVAETVSAVLGQTMTDLELIVVDDGSTDGTADVVAGFGDPRLHLVRLPANVGRGAARNAALRRARGRYVAICDADDVSLEDRFARQAAFLDDHPDIGVVGGQVANFGNWGGPEVVYRYPTTVATADQRFARGHNAVAHQASMGRRELFERVGGYAPACLRCQDLELFLRMRRLAPMVSLDEVVLLYRHEHRTALRYWLINGQWRRYAVAHAGATLVGREPVSYERFRRRPGAAAAVLWDGASFGRSRLHQRLAGTRAL